jgi:hypothetical protein
MTTTTPTWTPQDVNALDVAFGRVDGLMPAYETIPAEFKDSHTFWGKVVNLWFCRGLRGTEWKPKSGIDAGKAVAHVTAIMHSFEPRHEHKTAASAYLLSLWFDDVTYDGQER